MSVLPTKPPAADVGLRVVGVSHHTAPIEAREAAAVPAVKTLERLRRVVPDHAAEGVLLSTCNRTEFYLAGGDLDAAALLGPIAAPFAYDLRGEAAVRHLFRVAGSLDSLVPGEAQIVGQVRRAHAAAREAGLAGRRLHGPFALALRTARRVASETALAAGRHSVASLAVAYAQEVLGDLADRRVLCVGTGKMGRLVLEHLHARPPHGRPRGVEAVSRDAGKAKRLAGRFGGEGFGMDALPARLAGADLVVCATGSSRPVVTRDMLAGETRPRFVLDIAVPRDVEPAAGSLPGVFLYDLDDLRRAAADTAEGRRAELDKAEAIVESAVREHAARQRGRALGPGIARLYARGHATAGAEVDRLLRRLPPEQREALEPHARDLARRLVNKLLHPPVAALADPRLGEHHGAYRHAFERLFDVGEEDGRRTGTAGLRPHGPADSDPKAGGAGPTG